MANIEHLKEAISWVLDTQNKVEKFLKDGKIKFSESFSLLGQLLNFWKLVRQIKDIKAEFEDLDESEKKALYEYFSANFDLKNDKVESIIEKAFYAMLHLSDFVSVFLDSKLQKPVDETSDISDNDGKPEDFGVPPIEKPVGELQNSQNNSVENKPIHPAPDKLPDEIKL